jgi:hypothetical protein
MKLYRLRGPINHRLIQTLGAIISYSIRVRPGSTYFVIQVKT